MDARMAAPRRGTDKRRTTLDDKQAHIERLTRLLIGVFVFILVLAMYPYTNDPTNHVKKLLLSWAAFLLGTGWLAATWWFQLSLRRPRIFLELLVSLLILFAITALRSPFFGYSVIELSLFTFLFVLYAVSSQVYRTPAQVRRLMLVFCAAMAFSTLYGFAQKTGLDPFPWDDRTSDVYTNIPATFGNPNFAAHLLILTILMAVYFLATAYGKRRQPAPKDATEQEPRSDRRWIWLALVLVMFWIHLRFTGQRAGIIALLAAAVLVVAAVLIKGLVKRPVPSVLIALVLVALLGILGGSGAMLLAKWRTGSAFPLDVSLLVRYQSYVSASDMVLDKPILGHGPGVYGLAYPEYWTTFEKEWFAQEIRMNAHVHNDLLELAIDAGLPAAGLYLAVLLLGMSYGLLLAFVAPDPGRRGLGYLFAAFFAAFFVDGLFGFNLRVPVSATALFLMMGALEGLWLPSRPQRSQAQALRPWGKALCAAAIAVLFMFLVLQSRVFAAEYSLQQGMTAQDHASAIARYTEGERRAPWNFHFARRLGRVFMQQKDPERAIEHFMRSLELNPYYVLTHLPLAHAQRVVAQRAMRVNPQDYDKPLRLLDDAADHAQQVLQVCPMFPAAEDVLGRIAVTSAVFLGRDTSPGAPQRAETYWKAAEGHLQKAIRYGAQNQAELYRLLAQVRAATGRLEGTEEAFVRAAQSDPANTETWPVFVDFSNRHKRYDRLRDTLYAQIDRIKEMENPDSDALATVHLWLANVLENGYGDFDAVDNAYAQAVRQRPQRPEIWSNFARYAYDKGRLDALYTAISESCKQVESLGEKPLAHVAAVNAVLEQGAKVLDNASLVLMSHVRAHPKSAPATVSQTYAWAAQIFLEKLSEQSPGAAHACSAFLNLGIVFAACDDLNTADPLFSKAMECVTGPEKAFVAIHWADTLVRLERPENALKLLRDARRRYPENFDARWALARTLVMQGATKEARKEYEFLLQQEKLDPKGREMLEKELAGF